VMMVASWEGRMLSNTNPECGTGFGARQVSLLAIQSASLKRGTKLGAFRGHKAGGLLIPV
jgi:hypothetical protein